MVTKNGSISCRWLSGDETNLPCCSDVTKLKLEIARHKTVFPFDVIVFDREHCILEDTSKPPPEVAIIIKETRDYSRQMWFDTVLAFAACGDSDGVARSFKSMDRIDTRVADDALTHFVCANNLDALQTLRKSSDIVDVKRMGAEGFTPVMWAASEGREESARWCIQEKADVNAQGCFGLTAVMLSAARGFHEVTRVLLENGADTNVRNVTGSGALLDACLEGHLEAVELLISHNAAVDAASFDWKTPLMCAAGHKCVQIAELLIRHGANVNVHDADKKNTPLMRACELGSEEMVWMLLRHNAEVNAVNIDGQGALMKSLRRGSEPIAKLLLSYKAAVTADNRGRTPLSIAKKSSARYTHGLFKLIQRVQ
eukprot:GEMP01009187.1.p1 GENE.GEMP01009187.1~~GEMP01009187.1.p1  ORF type:complete len:370 (+),score=82.42 GEMP01009187.1:68-1177(+)